MLDTLFFLRYIRKDGRAKGLVGGDEVDAHYL